MKIKILFFALGAGLILASCSDKEAAAKMEQMEKDMHMKDSVCTASTQALMDTITAMKMREMEMMVTNKTSTQTTTTKTTTVPTTTGDKKLEVGTKEGTTTKKNIDIKKKGGTTSGGGN